MTTYILCDLNNIFYRCKHVIAKNTPTDLKSGMAIHIILNSIKKIFNKFNSGDHTHIVACVDGANSWRHEYYKNYKARRKLLKLQLSESDKEEDQLFFNAFQSFIKFLKERTNVTVLDSKQNIESDDWIARWIYLHKNDKHIIISGDTDFIQLINENVSIYDGVRGRLIDSTGIYDDNGKPVINKKTGKPENPPNPELALFLKICRGDSTDSIFPAAKSVRESKLMAAFEDRKQKSFDWINLMQQTWKDPDGITVRIQDKYLENKRLIDLNEQPQEIKDLMDDAIIEATQKPKKSQIGIWFLKFCDEHDLPSISSYPKPFITFLSETYVKD